MRLIIKDFLDEDTDDNNQQSAKVQRLSNDFRKSDESDDDIMVSGL